MPMDVLFAGVRVRDLATATDWYTRFFGRPADIAPNADEAMWRVTDSGWLYILREASRAGGGLVTICVTNLDMAVAELAARGISLGPIAAEGDAGRKATGEDPDGNSIALIEVSA